MDRKYINSVINNKFEKVNDEFVKCTISVLSCDQIANGTKFTRDGVERAIPTLNYAPLIGYFNGEDYEGHGQEIVLSSDGSVEFKVKTVPFGVVIKDTQRFQKVMKQNGEYEDYLVCDAYMWSRYEEATKKVMENECNQSMEIVVNDGQYKDNYFEVSDFNFEALCILGKDVTPAFSLAKIRTTDKFSKNEFESCYQEMLESFKKYSIENIDEGGVSVDKLKEELFEEEKVECENEEPTENVDYENEESTEEEFKKKKKCEDDSEEEFKKKKKCEDDSEEDKDEDEDEEDEEYSLENIEEIKAEYEKEIAELKVKVVDLDALYNESKTELEELRAFKAEYDKQIFESKLNDLLNKYSELRSIEGFEEILENGKELSLESLEKEFKIFAFDNGVVLGKKKFTAKKETTIKVPVGEIKDISVDPYGGILDKYIRK